MTGKADPDKPAAKTVRPANKRGVARLAAVQALYQMDVGDAPLKISQIEFTGRGVLTDTQSQGWLGRLMSKLNPF